MSVIGRLDGQVEEVIINPVGRRRDGEGGDAPTPQPARPETADATREPRERRRRDERDESDRAAELPVHLL